MAKSKKADEDTARQIIALERLKICAGTVTRLAVIVLLGFLGYCAFLSIEAMAGKATDFKSAIDWAVRVSISEFLAWCLVIILGTGFAYKSRAYKKIAA